MTRKLSVSVAVVGVVVVSLSGCVSGGGPNGTTSGDPAATQDPSAVAELLASAHASFEEWRTGIAVVQAHARDSAWDVDQYGNLPDPCGEDGHSWRMRRSTPADGWRLPGSPEESAKEMASWLSAQPGWSDVTVQTYDAALATATVEGRNEDAHVDRLMLEFNHGEVADGLAMTVESTCLPGDAYDLTDAMYPGYDSGEVWLPDDLVPVPETELPGAPPIFVQDLVK